ncbi:pirin family protein [Cellvibrio japonicus]|uniref:Protein yhhW n=1 Tax=Cellvibrio japonicus (strain Ueda107) TaxID=498211 RepID=B3PH16_CELJU|nr:pirin family protein [Cellvibrio japonicus]ACE84927.1 Protein yhhW [Cellvibrio japonicus Ueda107]QEI13815.1 pirin family protein [Cellvibrio japonicus]QEI17389.1 pirin family protein [Cellvibrio japonicus]QEI20965.1 pirin family protein [Cellvibrio japonicus]
MISIRHSQERGHANFGWLDSHHSFSFGSYYDPAHMGFSALRVINDDRVAPEAGFATHGHSDMEIISYVLEGEIAHKDSEGNIATLPPGEFQLMSAGSGIRHSEFNPSRATPLHFLQIWIQPNVYGQQPGYQQKDFGRSPGLTLVVSPDGAEGSLVIKQDARLYQLLLEPNTRAQLTASKARKYYVHLVDGELDIEGTTLRPGDGAKLADISALVLAAKGEAVKALVFDLP